MRADRLLSLVLLLQHRGRMTAPELARELEVSQRTVLRDVDALSTAGIPVYAQRGRRGGFALLDGYTTDLTGLTHDEARALLVAGSRTNAAQTAPELASAMRKVVAALPHTRRSSATRDAERILVQPEGWLGRRDEEPADPDADRWLTVTRRAVFAGRRLDIVYAATGQEPRRRTVDPIGLVSAGGRWYLLATHNGAERSYRMSRVRSAVERDEPAVRPPGVDLDRLWQEHRARFVAGPALPVRVRVRAERRGQLTRIARPVTAERPDGTGWLLVELGFVDHSHAEGVLWSLGPDAEVLEPAPLRAALAERAAAMAARYG